MEKQIHYLIIATHLPSDSEVLFFPTAEKAKAEFQKRTQPLLAIEGLEEDTDYYETDNGIRFYSGNNEELSAELGDVDHYFEVDTVQVHHDCKYYVALFSEWVDESMINFCYKDESVNLYNDMVNGAIKEHNQMRSDKLINRHDQSTWEDDEVTLFSETDNGDGSTDAFFGVSDVYWTYRIGKVILTK
jgi:hypothetical protein